MLCAVLCQVLGEVIQPGERLVVAEGGKGGRGVVAPSRIQKQTELKKEYERAQVCGGVDTDSASSQSINHLMCLGVGRGGGGEVCRSEASGFPTMGSLTMAVMQGTQVFLLMRAHAPVCVSKESWC